MRIIIEIEGGASQPEIVLRSSSSSTQTMSDGIVKSSGATSGATDAGAAPTGDSGAQSTGTMSAPSASSTDAAGAQSAGAAPSTDAGG